MPPVTCVRTAGLHVEELEFCTEEASSSSQGWVPLRILQAGPSSRKRPCVIFLHATGSSMDSQHAKMVEYATAGYITAAIDCRYHGRRCPTHDVGGVSPRDAYQMALVR